MNYIGATGYVAASYQKTHEISLKIMAALAGEDSGYATLGSMLSVARLQHEERLDPKVEVQFLKDAMDWVVTYFAVKDGVLN